MKKKYSIYCSGGASRLFKFYELEGNFLKYPLSAIVYDGGRADVEEKINQLFPNTPKEFIKYDTLMKPSMQSTFLSNQLLSINLNHQIDYTYCFGDKILKNELLEKYKNKIINFHPSILPAFPGTNAIDKALASSTQLLGNTAHFVDAGIDSGLIILQTVMSKKDFENYESVLSLQVTMWEKIWNWLEEDLIEVLDSKVIVSNSIGIVPPFFSN